MRGGADLSRVSRPTRSLPQIAAWRSIRSRPARLALAPPLTLTPLPVKRGEGDGDVSATYQLTASPPSPMFAARSTGAGMPFARVNGIVVHHDVSGSKDKPPLVLINSLGT